MSSIQMTDSQLMLNARLPSFLESTLVWGNGSEQHSTRRRCPSPGDIEPRPTLVAPTEVAILGDTPVPEDRAEEIANCASHALGVVFSIAASVVLIRFALSTGSASHTIACVVYGSTAIALYLASTVYHAVSNETLKLQFQVVDHACIYLFIAGSYTPFLMTGMRGPLGWMLLVAIWTMAVVGIWTKVVATRPLTTMSAVPYVAMGWLVVFAAKPLIESLPLESFGWIVVGGFFYTTGVYFFVRDQRRYNHFLWHLFVLAGSVSHFLAIAATITATAP